LPNENFSLQRTKEEWQVVFFICSAVLVFSALVFLVLGSGLEQLWAKDPNLNLEVGVSVDGVSEPTMEYHNHIATNCHIMKERSVNGQAIKENELDSKQSVQSDCKHKPQMIFQSVQVNGTGGINLSFDMNESFRTVQISDDSTISDCCVTGVSSITGKNDDTSKRVCTIDSSEIRKNTNSKDHFTTSTLKINGTKREVTKL
jgi:hypothetical protein